MTWIGSIIITLIFYQNLSDYISDKLKQFDFFENLGLSVIFGVIISIPIIFILSLIILRKLRKVISSDIVDIDFGICQILDLYLGLVESRLER